MLYLPHLSLVASPPGVKPSFGLVVRLGEPMGGGLMGGDSKVNIVLQAEVGPGLGTGVPAFPAAPFQRSTRSAILSQ